MAGAEAPSKTNKRDRNQRREHTNDEKKIFEEAFRVRLSAFSHETFIDAHTPGLGHGNGFVGFCLLGSFFCLLGSLFHMRCDGVRQDILLGSDRSNTYI